MRSPALRTSLLVLGLLGSGCATTGRVAGTAGPVEWEVVNVGRMDSLNGARTRWSYTIVLKNTGGAPIQFERIDRGARIRAYEIVGGLETVDFNQRLEANREFRYHTTSDWGWLQASGRQFGGVDAVGGLTIENRFVGKDSAGQAIVVPVRVAMDRSFGRASRQPPRPEPPTPPAKPLQAQDLASLAGRWAGYYRSATFAVPLEALVRADGSVEFEENDPVTNTFRRQLTVRNGKLTYTGRDSGELAYHENAERRMLVGQITYRTAGGGSGQMPLWLERTGDVPATTAAAPTPTTAALPAPGPTASLPPAIQRAFDTWRTDRMYQPFKAFAFDRGVGTWGGSWSLGSAESAGARAMEECRKRGVACELHAINDTVLASLSPERRALLMLGGVYLHYQGTLTVEREGRVERSPATVTLRRGLTEIIGAWSSEERGLSGTIKDGASDSNPASVRLTMTDPCRAELTGVVALGEDGKTAEFSYAGADCDGLPMRATFTGARP